MKKLFVLLAFAAALTACNNSSDEKTTGTDTAQSEASEAASVVAGADSTGHPDATHKMPVDTSAKK